VTTATSSRRQKKLVRIRETDNLSQGLSRRLISVISDRKDADGQGRFTSAKEGLICNALQQVVYSIKHVFTPDIRQDTSAQDSPQ
jgi:hypothetical protein